MLLSRFDIGFRNVSEQFILEDPKNYTFLSYGNVQVPGMDEAEEFAATNQAMRIMGISEEDISSIWKVRDFSFFANS